MNTNVRAPIMLVKEALPHIPRGGRIINISSYATRDVMIGPGIPDMALYICSKIALEGLTQGWAVEFGQSRGINVNAVSVGPTETDLIASMPEEQKAILAQQVALKMPAAPRSGTPDDVAQVVAFLASDSARWVTGSTVSANGGIIAI
jgi:3-oxoacyl-[acyl-carrier protein] reductase